MGSVRGPGGGALRAALTFVPAALTLAPAVLVLALAPAAAGDSWVELRPDSAGFRVELPGTPEYEPTSNLTVVGRIVEHLYVREEAEATFWVTWSRLPRVAIWFAARDGIFENVRRGFLERSDVEAGEFTTVYAGALEGRELRYVSEEPGPGAGRGRLRTFLDGRTLLVFDAVSRSSRGAAMVDRFFESLQIGPQPDPGEAR